MTKDKVYKYPSFVLKEKIRFIGKSKDNLRYLLVVPISTHDEKSILVIMKNPSKADKLKSDHTINNVLNFCKGQGYTTVYIMNLYAFYSTNPKGIKDLIMNNFNNQAVGKFSNLILKCVLLKVEHIIVAWGSNTFGCTTNYKTRISEVKDKICRKDVYFVQTNGGKGWYPRHAQVWHVNQNIAMFNWISPE